MSDDDSQERFALGFLFALIALVISVVVGTVVVKQLGASGAASPAAATAVVIDSAPAADAASVDDAATVLVEAGVVKFYFASGKADLAAGANEALADVVTGAKAGRKVTISGFHDATGDAAQNAELAKQRALVVRDALTAAGVAEAQIELKKPEQVTTTGSDAEARRVEISLQ